jgi:hypothetical protein
MIPVDFCEEYYRCGSEFARLDQLSARNSLKRSCTINNLSVNLKFNPAAKFTMKQKSGLGRYLVWAIVPALLLIRWQGKYVGDSIQLAKPR